MSRDNGRAAGAAPGRKALIAIGLGLLGFALDLLPLRVDAPPYSVAILFGLVLPLMVAVAYGPWYGLLSATVGMGAQFPWFLWSSNGWACLVVALATTAWFVLHGFVARSAAGRRSWYSACYVAEAPFRLLYVLLLFTVYRWAIGANPPPWRSDGLTAISTSALTAIAVGAIISGYLALFLADLLLGAATVRRALGLPDDSAAHFDARVMAVSLAAGAALWAIDAVADAAFFNPEHRSFADVLLLRMEPQEVFLRLIMLAACGVGGVVASREIARRRLTEEDLRTTLESIGDAVIATDTEGRVTRMNGVAEALTGWPRAAAAGRPLAEVFRIRSETTGAAMESPVERVLAEGVVVGLANHTELVRRDGSAVPISDSGAPIRSADGEIRGVVLVFRDQTAERAAENAVLESEARFRSLVESSPMGIHLYRLEEDGRLIFLAANPAADRMTGTDNSAFVGQTIEEAFPSLVGTDVPDRYRDVARNGTVWRTENMLYEDTQIVGAFDVLAFRPAPNQIAAVFNEITDRKRAEHTLARSEAMFRTYFELGRVGMAISSPDHQWLRVNRRLCEILGYTREELIGTNWAGLTHPDDLEANLVLFRRMLNGDVDGYSLQKRFVRKDGSIVWVDLHASCSRLSPGGPAEFIVSQVEDITERRRAEEETRRLAIAVEQAAEEILIVGLEGTILYANPAIAHISGFQPADVIGRRLDSFRTRLHGGPDHGAIWETISAGRVWAGRLTNERPDGSPVEIEATISPIRGGDGRVTAYVSVGRDVTEQTRLENQLRQSQELEAIGRLAGGVAHDFNNLLVPILGYAEMLLRQRTEADEAHAPLSAIQQAAERARELVQQLLAFGRKQVISLRAVELQDVASGFEPILRRMIREDIEVVLAAPAEPLVVLGDRSQIERILMNLALNAQDAMPGGGRLRIELDRVEKEDGSPAGAEELPPGWYARICVHDTGEGMTPEVLERVFEPFFSTKEVGKGTGLGLATVYGMVKQHNGAIVAASVPGEGTRFDVYLPLAGDAAADVRPAADEAAGRGTETLIVVEDNDMARDLVVAALSREGYHVLAAASPEECMTQLDAYSGPVQLLVTDVVMPTMNGRELHARLLAARPDLRVLYMSGYTHDVIAQHGVLDPHVRFLEKPFTMKDLSRTVRQALDA